MKPAAYYNEIDPFAAQWLRNLIAGGHIAPGEVDERSIEDVTPDDLRGFTQCHFFAGIGGWSYALRLARWPDNKPVWTASCPCQPFSAAGKGAGFDDERHLWPHLRWLTKQRRPFKIFGEQSASGRANVWFDLVQNDLENMGYSFGIVPFPAACVGAPNERDRAYWVADADMQYESTARNQKRSSEFIRSGEIIRLANTDSERRDRLDSLLQRQEFGRLAENMPETSRIGIAGGMADSDSQQQRQIPLNRKSDEHVQIRRSQATTTLTGLRGDMRPLEVNGFWRDADWISCRDGKWRPVEPVTFPLVNGFPKGMGHGKSSPRALAGRNRIGRLKGYGNAINVHAAAAFIRSYLEVSDGR